MPEQPVPVCPRCGHAVLIDQPQPTRTWMPSATGGEWIDSAPLDMGKVCKICWELDHGRPPVIWRDGVAVNR